MQQSSWPLESFTVTGNSKYSREQILAVTGLKIGQTVTKADFDAARDRLVATGAFDSVGYGFKPADHSKGYAATFEVVEVNQLYPLRFEDLPATDAELRAWLKEKDPLFGSRIPATKEALERYRKWIAEFLGKKNYHEPIAGRLSPENPPELTVVFRPAAPRPTVAHVKFTGMEAIPASILQSVMAEVSRGTVYTEPTFRVLLDNNIRPLYEAKGYVRVAFPKITTEPDKDVKGLDVTVEVKEGPVYKLGAVHVAAPGGREAELVKLAGLRTGDTVDFDEVKNARGKIEQSFRRGGYLQVSSEVKRSYNDPAKTVDVTLQVTPGPQFTFAKLNVVGLDIETEPAIRKMWGLQPGKPFNIDYPDHFLNRVREDGVLDNLKTTRAEHKLNAENRTVEVTLYFNK